MHKVLYKIVLSITLLLGSCSWVPAATSIVREVKVSVSPFISVDSWSKGYLEYRVKLTNQSASNRRRVTLSLPQQLQQGPAVKSSFEVNTLQTVTGRFYLPSLTTFEGENIEITVDGKSASMKMRLPKYDPADAQINKKTFILVSKSCRMPFLLQKELSKYRSTNARIVPSNYDITEWSDNWLAYSVCNAVIITNRDIPKMSPEVAQALKGYVSMGGRILIIGSEALPEKIFSPFGADGPTRRMTVGLGEAMVLSNPKSKLPVRFLVASRQTSANLFNDAILPFAPQKLSKTMIMLIILSVYVILTVLAIFISWKLRRRAVLAIVLPLISILACGAIIICVSLSESFADRHRLDSITFLDQGSDYANSFGLLGIYHPMSVKTLNFSRETACEYLSDNYQLPGCYVNWSTMQNLWGFIEARKAGYFKLMRSCQTQKDLKFEYEGKNPFKVYNNFGCNIRMVLVRSQTGYHFIAENVPPGQWVQLKLIKTLPGEISTSQNTLFKALGKFWPGLWQCKGYSDYIALVSESPFLSAGLEKSDQIDCLSIICGKMESVEK